MSKGHCIIQHTCKNPVHAATIKKEMTCPPMNFLANFLREAWIRASDLRHSKGCISGALSVGLQAVKSHLDTVLYCTVLYCTVLYCTVLYCTVLYCTVLYCTVLYFTVLYCTVLYCTVLYCTVLYCTVLYCTVLYCTVLYCTVLSWGPIDRVLFL